MSNEQKVLPQKNSLSKIKKSLTITINFRKQVKKLIKNWKNKVLTVLFQGYLFKSELAFKSKSSLNCIITKMNLTQKIEIEERRKL